MKTTKITLQTIKDSDGWMELIHELKYEQFKNKNPEMNDDELSDKFYEDVVLNTFRYGEYADFEIEIDENLNIIGGKIIPFKKEK